MTTLAELPQKRKKKEAQKLEFDAAFVTKDVKSDDLLELDFESARYVAQHGQGGDRRG